MKIQKVGILALILTLTLLSSCVGKKRYLAALNSISELQTTHDSEISQWQTLLDREKNNNQNLSLQLAEKKGETTALTAMQDKLQNRIDELEEQIDNMSNQSVSSQQQLNTTIKAKDTRIAELEAQIASITESLDRFASLFNQVSGDLSLALQGFSFEDYAVETVSEGVRVVLFEQLIFTKGSASRITSDGESALELISPIIQRYPDMSIVVTAHTDNDKPSNRSYKNNWIYSSLRSAAVVRMLVNDYDVSASQITAAAKGEFAPRASNDDPEGKASNRRIELLFRPNVEGLERDIRKKL